MTKVGAFRSSQILNLLLIQIYYSNAIINYFDLAI